MSRQGCRFLTISGGEPLLHPEWRTLIDLTNKVGINPILSTNGLLVNTLNDSIINQLDTFTIPLESSYEDENDLLRGTGHFNKIMRLIEEYKNGRFVFRLKVNTIVTPLNKHRLEDIANVVNDHRITWKLFQPSSRGHFNRSGKDLSLATSEFLHIVDSLRFRPGVKCWVQWLTEIDALNYIVVDPLADVYMPTMAGYKRAFSLLDDDVSQKTKLFGLKGSSFLQGSFGRDPLEEVRV